MLQRSSYIYPVVVERIFNHIKLIAIDLRKLLDDQVLNLIISLKYYFQTAFLNFLLSLTKI